MIVHVHTHVNSIFFLTCYVYRVRFPSTRLRQIQVNQLKKAPQSEYTVQLYNIHLYRLANNNIAYNGLYTWIYRTWYEYPKVISRH